MSLAWTRSWSRSVNLPRAFVRSAGALFVLRDRGWITVSGAEPPEAHDRWGRPLRRLLQARSGALWAIDAAGALLRHDGNGFRGEGAVPSGDVDSPASLCLLLDATGRDGGPSLQHGLSHIDVIHAGALVRCTARRAEPLWRGSTETRVTYQGASRSLRDLLDGESFQMLAVGSLANADALVVDHTGALLRITPRGHAECLRGGTVYREFRHTYPDPDPDEYTYPARAAVVAPDGAAWIARPGKEIARIVSREVQHFQIQTPSGLEALGLGPDGTLWGICASYRQGWEDDDKGPWRRCSGSLLALAGPGAGVRVSFEPPAVQGTIGVDAWLIEDGDHPGVVRIDGDGEVTDRVARTGELPDPRVTSVVLSGVRWEAEGERLCVRGAEGLTTVAEAQAPIRALVIDDATLWVLTETSILRWNGAALVDMGGPRGRLRQLAVQRGKLLALSADHAWTAQAPPLDPPIKPASPRDLAVLERLLSRALCPLSVTAQPLRAPVTSADTLATAIGLPPLRGKWAEVPAPVAGAAIDRLWAGDETSPGLDDDLRVRIAGCFARAAEPESTWLVRAGKARVHAVMVCTRGFVLATWVMPDVER